MAFDISEIKYLLENNKEGISFFAIFFLLFLFCFVILKKTFLREKNEQMIVGLISIVVAGLGTWYLSTTEFLTIIQTYTYLGMVVFLALPLVLVIAVLHRVNSTPTIRRIVEIVVGIGLYYLVSKGEIVEEIPTSITLVWFGLVLFVVIFDSAISNVFSKNGGSGGSSSGGPVNITIGGHP